jgi:soluble lytic murein transglycosylase-like protein
MISAPKLWLVLFAGLELSFAAERKVSAAVYTQRDAQGVYHFSSVPRPGWVLFGTGPSSVGRLRPRSERVYRGIIRDCAAKYGVEPALVKAMIRAESAFDPRAVSPKGARGLMQLTAGTARKHGVANIHDPRENIRGGVGHLRGLLDQFDNDLPLAIAAYNAGAGSVLRYGGLPPYRETRVYVARVLRLRREYLRQEKAALAHRS